MGSRSDYTLFLFFPFAMTYQPIFSYSTETETRGKSRRCLQVSPECQNAFKYRWKLEKPGLKAYRSAS